MTTLEVYEQPTKFDVLEDGSLGELIDAPTSVEYGFGGPRGPVGPTQNTVSIMCTDPNGVSLAEMGLMSPITWRVGPAINGKSLIYVAASLVEPSTSGQVEIRVRNITQGGNMVSTNITIDEGETDSSTAAVPAVIDDAYKVVNTADKLRIDILGYGLGAKGLQVDLQFSN